MKNDLPRKMTTQEISQYLEMLDFMSESTGDYFYLMELNPVRIHFSDIIYETFALPYDVDVVHTLEDWAKVIYPRDRDVVIADLMQLQRGEKHTHSMEYRIFDRERKLMWVNCRGKVSCDEEGRPFVLFGRISNKLLGENVDPLTGLLNSSKCMEDVANTLQQKKSGYLLVFDIDNFKETNIKYGREHGDSILKNVTQTLESIVESTIPLYRLEGDRFGINLPVQDSDLVQRTYDKIQQATSSYCTLSAGAVFYKEGMDTDSADLYQYAEVALDHAKQQGKNKLVFFSQDDYEERRNVIELQMEMEESIRNNFEGFFLCYQPQIDCRTYRIFGVETLLRYNSPTRGLVRPDEFIPLLEQKELICDVGKWVLETALAVCSEWRESIPNLHISVNMSYVQLRQKGITEDVLNALYESGLPGNALTLELTESAQLQDYQHFNLIFYQWEKAGIQIAIDDFGTGYSSLAYLKSIEVNEIKMDRCFVRGIQHSAYNYQLLKNTIELARSAEIRVCCEGVETEEELLVLKELQPDILQGYFFAMPYSQEEFEEHYIHADSQVYQDRVVFEEHYTMLDKENAGTEMVALENSDLSLIIESMDDVVYVSDVDSFELYYLNSAGRRLTGIYDYKGRKCYEVIGGSKEPCAGCMNKVLTKDGFRIGETHNRYLNRHFLVRQKLIPLQNRIARLEIAIDITERELVSQSIQDKLDFEKNIVSYARVLVEENSTDRAIVKVLQAIGEFYQADRTYIFEPAEDDKYWNNTYEWCNENIVSQKDNLQRVPYRFMRRWFTYFNADQPVIIENLDDIREESPDEWEILSSQGIQCLIATPILRNGEMIGFIGSDNPKLHQKDETLQSTMSCFLADRLAQSATESNISKIPNYRNEDILGRVKLGLWVIRLHDNPAENEMFADRMMMQVLGIQDDASPAECYQHWYRRINEGYYHYVTTGVERMLYSGNVAQFEYTWNHPILGDVVVRCVGIRGQDSEGMPCIEGYHRMISDIDRPTFMPETAHRAIFEYNERRKAIYFHSGRELLGIEEESIESFPDCWIHQKIVHPDFAEQFKDIFSEVKKGEELNGVEMLLRNDHGTYEWFKVRTRHIGNNTQDKHTIIVLLDQANQERMMELEFLRKSDFYEAMLSETIAYAEIDVEKGLLQRAGGLWKPYEIECHRCEESFQTVISRHLEEVVAEEDVARCSTYFDDIAIRKWYEKGNRTQKYAFRRLVGGEMRWVELAVHVFQERYTKSTSALLYLKDIDMQKKREEEQESAANRDPLTNVYNRRMFERQVNHFMNQKKNRVFGTLILIDIDNFKWINDRYGHIQGDASLIGVTDTLRKTFRSGDIIGRLGGDEFLVFIKGVTSRAVLDARVKELFESLKQSEIIPLTCSMGITFAGSDKFSYETSLNEADQALYESKQLGKNRACYYEDMKHN